MDFAGPVCWAEKQNKKMSRALARVYCLTAGYGAGQPLCIGGAAAWSLVIGLVDFAPINVWEKFVHRSARQFSQLSPHFRVVVATG